MRMKTFFAVRCHDDGKVYPFIRNTSDEKDVLDVLDSGELVFSINFDADVPGAMVNIESSARAEAVKRGVKLVGL